MRNSPARAHYERVSAAGRDAHGGGATRADLTAYELMLAKLAEDRRRLHDIQSVERKAALKATLLPDYTAWVEGTMAGDKGLQDDVLMTVMVWRIDVGDLEGALKIAGYALKHKLSMPDQYKRSTGCLIAEECADYALRLKDGIPAELVGNLATAELLTRGEDMPDEVRARLLKALGYGIEQNAECESDKATALDLLRTALSLHDKVGVKKDIERLERYIKNSAPAPASAEGGG